MKYFLISLIFVVISCVPPEEDEGSTFYEDSATREAMQNLKQNQGSPLSSGNNTYPPGSPPPAGYPLALLLKKDTNQAYETLKKPDLAGRWYLFNLFGSIYNQATSNKTPNNEEILRSSILNNVNVFGSACDPNEVIVKGVDYNETITNGISNPDSKCDNRDFWDPMRRDTSILRNGWKISMCGQLNQGFSYDNNPLDLLHTLYFEDEAKKAVEVSIDDKSIKIAYHLFNRFHSPPSEVSTALKKINNLEEEDLSNDPSKYSDDGNGGDLNEVETKNIKKWRRIFYLLCIDPNNEII